MSIPVFTEQGPWIDAVVAQHAERFGQAAEAGTHIDMIVSDVDGVILDADMRWHEYYAGMLSDQPDQVVPLDEFRTGYRRFMAPLVDDYDTLKAQLMHDPEFHRNMPLMPDAEVLPGRGRAHRAPHGYITTRPAVLGEVTAENLQERGVHEAPLLIRSEQIDYDGTVDFKVNALVGLRRALNASGTLERLAIHYVDDFQELAKRVNAVGAGEYGALYATHYTRDLSWRSILRDHLCLGDNEPL